MSQSHHQQGSHPKLKPPPRALFSCGIFRHCTQSALSPTSTSPPCSSSPPPVTSAATKDTITTSLAAAGASSPSPLSSASPPPPTSSKTAPTPSSVASADAAPDRPPPSTSSSSSSSSSASQSFTQWRFPLHHTHPHQPSPKSEIERWTPGGDSTTAYSVGLTESFHAAELQFASGARLPTTCLLELALASHPSPSTVPCPPPVMAGLVAALRDPAAARPAAKVLLTLLLAEQNRRTAVEAGAVSAAVEMVAAALASRKSGGKTTAERTLAALELLCTVAEGAAEVRGHAGAAAALAEAADTMVGRGRECAVGVMAAIYSDDRVAPPPDVARAVVAAMHGECSARGRRKGAQLLRALQESGRLDLAVAIDGCY